MITGAVKDEPEGCDGVTFLDESVLFLRLRGRGAGAKRSAADFISCGSATLRVSTGGNSDGNCALDGATDAGVLRCALRPESLESKA